MNTAVVAGSVVVGVDGTPPSEVALRWAADCARQQGRALTIVHAAGRISTAETLHDRLEARQAHRIAGRAIIDAAVDCVHERCPALRVDSWMPLGEPHTVLRAAAARAHLLVVGSRGRGSLAALLLGSVGAGVAAQAPCPVVVARTDHRDHGTTRGIVVGVDGSETSASAVAMAFDLASWRNEPLEVVHAFDGLGAWTVPDLLEPDQASDLVEQGEVRVAEAVAGYAEKYPDVEVSVRLAPVDAVTALVHESHRASTVVVGSRGRGRAASMMLGSTSREVVRLSRSTVVVVGSTPR